MESVKLVPAALAQVPEWTQNILASQVMAATNSVTAATRFSEYCVPVTTGPRSRTNHFVSFLPRCIECRRGLAMRILSVCQTRDL